MSILHADNPTTSLGHPHSYSGSFLGSHPNNTSSSFSASDIVTQGQWLIDNDLVSARPSYVDRLLGLDESGEDEIVKFFNNGTSEVSTNVFYNGKSHYQLRNLCQQILTQKIPKIGVRFWDATIFTINLLFLLFLLAKVIYIWKRKLKSSIGSTMFKEFFVLVFIITLLNMSHSIGSATLSLTNQIGTLIDQIIWFSLKFALFTAEICVLFFGLCFGQSASIRGVCSGLFIAIIFALIHSAFQSIFDFRLWDQYINFDFLPVNGYQELNFWVVSSAVIGTIYLFMGFIPLVCCRNQHCILHRCSFFLYCLLMSILNFAQSLAAILIRLDCPDGLCVADLVSLAYFTLFAPTLYFLFLSGLTRTKRVGGLFTYRTHKNDPSSEANGYYPRFSGLISPSYDDLFDYDRIMQQQNNTQMENILHLNYDFYHVAGNDSQAIPLMNRTPDSTLTTQLDSDPSGQDAADFSTTSESRPIIRAPYASGSTFQSHSARSPYKPKNLQVRPDGQLTFSTVSSSFNE